MNKKKYSLKPMVSPHSLKRPVCWDEEFGRQVPMDVEIGFGLGEVLTRGACQSPERNFLGIEQHTERVYKTLRRISQERALRPGSRENIRILKADARIVFERLFVSESIDRLYCLFPCPWPKKGHVKHRLFSSDFLCLLNNRLKPKGTLKVVTDSYPYYQWILEQVPSAGFQIDVKTVSPQYGTKFERKWQEKGQEEFFELCFEKINHVEYVVKKDTPLKSYMLDDVNIDEIQLEDQTGDVSIIFKDMLFDRDKEKAMICSLVCEENLTQYFWVSIFKRRGKWRVAKADGQGFFPTPGINKAVALVYEAALRTIE